MTPRLTERSDHQLLVDVPSTYLPSRPEGISRGTSGEAFRPVLSGRGLANTCWVNSHRNVCRPGGLHKLRAH